MHYVQLDSLFSDLVYKSILLKSHYFCTLQLKISQPNYNNIYFLICVVQIIPLHLIKRLMIDQRNWVILIDKIAHES